MGATNWLILWFLLNHIAFIAAVGVMSRTMELSYDLLQSVDIATHEKYDRNDRNDRESSFRSRDSLLTIVCSLSATEFVPHPCAIIHGHDYVTWAVQG